MSITMNRVIKINWCTKCLEAENMNRLLARFKIKYKQDPNHQKDEVNRKKYMLFLK